MEQVSVRMPESMRDRLEDEAEEREMGLAEYIRYQLRQGDEIGERLDELAERVDDLEDKLGQQKVARAVSRRSSAEIVSELEDEGEDVGADQGGAVDGDQEASVDAGDGQEPLDVASSIEEALEGWPPYGEQHRERRREVGAEAVEWLRGRDEPASGGDFKEALYEGLPVAEQNPDTWWRKSVRPAVKRCVDADLIEYREGYHDYRWTASSA